MLDSTHGQETTQTVLFGPAHTARRDKTWLMMQRGIDHTCMRSAECCRVLHHHVAHARDHCRSSLQTAACDACRRTLCLAEHQQSSSAICCSAGNNQGLQTSDVLQVVSDGQEVQCVERIASQALHTSCCGSPIRTTLVHDRSATLRTAGSVQQQGKTSACLD